MYAGAFFFSLWGKSIPVLFFRGRGVITTEAYYCQLIKKYFMSNAGLNQSRDSVVRACLMSPGGEGGGGDHDICDVSQQYNSSKYSFMIYLVSAKNLWVYPHVCFRVGIF